MYSCIVPSRNFMLNVVEFGTNDSILLNLSDAHIFCTAIMEKLASLGIVQVEGQHVWKHWQT